MIIKAKNEDIFNTKEKHIAFAVNTKGFNDSGFSGLISSTYWKELAKYGEQKLGTVMSKQVGDKIFHALVCYSLKAKGWGNNQAEIIKKCFDNIQSNGEAIASIAIGTGLVGQMTGANFRQIIVGMHQSKQNIILHSLLTMEEIKKCVCEELGIKMKKYNKKQ